jgi:molecular chaperone DnaJ
MFLLVHVEPHPMFGRKGTHLTITVPVTFDEAALGAQIQVPTLEGPPVRIKIPAGTPTGRTFRAGGKGGTTATGSRGDLLVTVEVQVPAELSDVERTAVEALRDARGSVTPRDDLFEGAAS